MIASLSARAPWWVPTILVGGSAVLLALARPFGDRFRRTDVPIVDLRDQVLPGPEVIRRKVAKIGATFVVAAVVTAIGVTVLNALDRSGPHEAVIGILLAGQLTFLATAFAAIIVAFPFSRLLRDAGGRDVDRLRRYAKLVLRGKGSPAAVDEQRAVVRYVEVVQVVLQFNLAYVMLLYVSIAFQFVSGILRGDLVVVSAVFLVLMVSALVWLLPRTISRIRRARRYVEEHRSPTEGQRPEIPLL